MSIWTNYNIKLGAMGETARDRNLKRTQLRISNKIRGSLSYYTVIIDGQERSVAITKTKEGRDIKNMYSMPNETFERGSLVEWMDNFWLIISHDVQDEVYTSATIQQCNYLLRWINEDGNIIERHCIITNNDRNSSGERENTKMTIGDNRLNLILAKDSETQKIHRGQRFLVDDPDATNNILAYQVTKPDRLPGLYDSHGVYTFGLRECNRSTADNIDLMVADYDLFNKKHTSESEDNTVQYKLYLGNAPVVEVPIGDVIDIPILLIDQTTGTPIENASFEYDIGCDGEIAKVIDSDNSHISIKIENKPRNIGIEFKVSVFSKLYNVSSEQNILIVGWS